MKNKYTFWLILLAIFSSSFAFSQTNPTNMVGAWQQKDTVGGKVVQFRNSSTSLGVTKIVTPATLRDSLKNYAQIQDGLISGGTPTTNGDSLIVASGVARINSVNYNFTGRTFANIPPSAVGLSRILIVYANTSGLLDSISGVESNNPVSPTLLSNTIRVVTVTVSDAGLGSPSVDLTGYAKLVGDNYFTGNQNIKGYASTNSFFKITDISEQKRILIGNQDSGGTNRPAILMGVNSNFHFGYGDTWTNNGGNLTTNLFLSGFSGNLGLGTITPYTKQEIVGGKLQVNTGSSLGFAGESAINTYSAGGSRITFYDNSNRSSIGSVENGILSELSFQTDGNSERMRINATGVGIGTTNPTSRLHVNGLARATGFGAGIAPSANHYLTTAANTSTIGSWLWTPSSTDYTGTVSGTFYNNANELKFYDGTISGTNRLVKLRNNESFSGIGSSGLISSNTGDVSALPLVDRLTAGEVQTSTNRTLSLIDFGSNGSLTVYCTTTGGDVTITLPSVSDMRYLEVTIIKVTAGNNVIISGSANINGSASITESAQYKSYTLVSNGTQYYIKGERP